MENIDIRQEMEALIRLLRLMPDEVKEKLWEHIQASIGGQYVKHQ